MEPSHSAYLDIRLSTAPGPLWQRVWLTDADMPIGRPEQGEPGVDLKCSNVSRQHACIVCEKADEEATYFVKNVRGQEGIRLYEKMLLPGERHILRHGYVFHIPGMQATSADPYFSITFCMDAVTMSLSIKFGQPPHISIFGRIVRFTRQEYMLLEYLYAHKNEICPYREIIAYIWTDQPRTPERIQVYLEQLQRDRDEYSYKKEALDILLTKVRRKISDASGGVALIETIHGEGLCLRT
jgi:hypothetical protein